MYSILRDVGAHLFYICPRDGTPRQRRSDHKSWPPDCRLYGSDTSAPCLTCLALKCLSWLRSRPKSRRIPVRTEYLRIIAVYRCSMAPSLDVKSEIPELHRLMVLKAVP